ncbi:MAG: response regulator [Promethearchaeota archaeon]
MIGGDNKDLEEEIERTEEMDLYEKETGKYAVWRGTVTEAFKKWQKGEKIYDRDKERISLYVSEETKNQWQDFIKEKKYSTISKLIRESVSYFIEKHSKLGGNDLLKFNGEILSGISHALKEPLTTIKGFSQLLLEAYNDELNDEVLATVQNIFDQSILLENKIINILDDIKVEQESVDILLIEDDLATIRLLKSFFESRGHTCKGVISGTKGIEELRVITPKVILLDVILPDVSGYDLCKIIKSEKKLKDIPLYLLTAIPGSEVQKNFAETGANGYILKPFNLSDFEVIFNFI